MHCVSSSFTFPHRELSLDELHLQRRLDRSRWKHVHSVRGRQVQDFNRIGRVHGLRGREVFYTSRGLRKLDMQRLSSRLHLACGELSFDKLHLQRRINRTRWRYVHSVRGRQVQGFNRIGRVHGLRGREVFYTTRGLS